MKHNWGEELNPTYEADHLFGRIPVGWVERSETQQMFSVGYSPKKRSKPTLRMEIGHAFMWGCTQYAPEKTSVPYLWHGRPAHGHHGLEARATG
jgi:hypothetical protein